MNGRNRRRAQRCVLCGRVPAATDHRMPSRIGPVCARCLQAGLDVVNHRGAAAQAASGFVRVSSTNSACDICGRTGRRTLLGTHRSLPRVRGPGSAVVICADCLDRGGDLVNRSWRP